MRSYAQYNSCYILYKVRFPRRFLLPQLVIVANVLGVVLSTLESHSHKRVFRHGDGYSKETVTILKAI